MKKIALVGCGRVSSQHFEHLSNIGQLTAVCDIVEEKAIVPAQRYGVPSYTSFDALLKHETPDLVVVCTPNGVHAEQIIKSLQAGCDVLTEKPLCLTTAAAWQMIETEKFCRRRIFLVQSVPYHPLLQSLSAVIINGELGRILSLSMDCIWHRPNEYFTDWHGTLFPDGGLLYNQFCHALDALVLIGGEITDANGFTDNALHQQTVEFEDGGTAALRFASGAIGTLHWTVNAFEKNHEIGLTIVAERGTIRLGGEFLNTVEYLVSNSALPLKSFNRNEVDFHASMYAHLADALASKAAFPSAYTGLQTVQAIEKIYKAVR